MISTSFPPDSQHLPLSVLSFPTPGSLPFCLPQGRIPTILSTPAADPHHSVYPRGGFPPFCLPQGRIPTVLSTPGADPHHSVYPRGGSRPFCLPPGADSHHSVYPRGGSPPFCLPQGRISTILSTHSYNDIYNTPTIIIIYLFFFTEETMEV